jgi:3-methylfumaryl-CoA hydratase
MNEIDIKFLQQWVGRKEEVQVLIAPIPAAALAATLDQTYMPEEGVPLGPLWHWIYFIPLARQSELGADGHPQLGRFMPPIPLPRRMWAGGRLQFLDSVLIGENVSRVTQILSITHKAGKQGPLIFVTLRHELRTSRGLAIIEEQDLVYRSPAPGLASAQTPAPGSAESRPAAWSSEIVPSPILLFRYSALTFNAHRIHYDLPYSRDQEGYPDLVVQGPLIATLIADRVCSNAKGRLIEFAFRAQNPLFVNAPFRLCGSTVDSAGHCSAWAETFGGIPSMSVSATVRPLE